MMSAREPQTICALAEVDDAIHNGTRTSAAALGKSLIVMQMPEHDHALKEVDAAALAVASEPSQVVEILTYVLTGKLPA